MGAAGGRRPFSEKAGPATHQGAISPRSQVALGNEVGAQAELGHSSRRSQAQLGNEELKACTARPMVGVEVRCASSRFELQGRTGYGILEGEKISVLWSTPYDGGLAKTTGEIVPCRRSPSWRPASRPRSWPWGSNYRDHATEFGHPLPEEPAALHEAQHHGDRPGRGHRLSRDEPAGGLRGGTGGGHR